MVADLGLSAMLETMAGGDVTVGEAARDALAHSVTDVNTLRYRQGVVRDALNNADAVRAMYDLATNMLADEHKEHFGMFREHPDTILRRSVTVLEMFAERLGELRRLAQSSAPGFESDAFRQLFSRLQAELDDDYLASIHAHLAEVGS